MPEPDPFSTPVLKTALRGWWRGHPMPAPLLDLKTFPELAHHATAMQRSMGLYDLLYDIADARLAFYRRSLGLVHPTTPPTTVSQVCRLLQADARAHALRPGPLIDWTAVLHRYLVPVRVRPGDMAACIGVSERQFRRYVHAGLHWLGLALRRRLDDAA